MSLSVALPAFVLLVLGAGRGAQAQGVCNDTLTCTAAGYFARCEDFCDTQYFTCEAAGQQGTLFTCPGETVFDPDPDNPYCVPFSECSTGSCYPTGPPFPVTCQGYATYPQCDYCSQYFYLCSWSLAIPFNATCEAGMVYNPVPSLGGCIPASACPCTTDDC